MTQWGKKNCIQFLTTSFAFQPARWFCIMCLFSCNVPTLQWLTDISRPCLIIDRIKNYCKELFQRLNSLLLQMVWITNVYQGYNGFNILYPILHLVNRLHFPCLYVHFLNYKKTKVICLYFYELRWPTKCSRSSNHVAYSSDINITSHELF